MFIWEKVKTVNELEKNSKTLLHMNPVHGIEVFDNLNLFEFNPYLGDEITSEKGGINLEGRTQKVVDSPGFAPVTTNNTKYKYGGNNYSNCSSLFNINRQMPTKQMRHEGVDLSPSDEKKPNRKSFIFGIVWACTYQGSIKENDRSGTYGRIMIIKALNDNKLYFLAHLDKYLKDVNDFVYPGDDVAVCGTTGNSSGVHLHVEVRICNETNREKVLKEGWNQKHKNDEPSSDGGELKWVENNVPQRVNPFNHKEEYLGVWL